MVLEPYPDFEPKQAWERRAVLFPTLLVVTVAPLALLAVSVGWLLG